MKYYKVSEEALKHLIRDSAELNHLENAGVDNWEGYPMRWEMLEDEGYDNYNMLVIDELSTYEEV
jgi:hypothetical protein